MIDPSAQGDLQAFFDARRRIIASFEDIATGTEALVSLAYGKLDDSAPTDSPPVDSGDERAEPEEVARLRALLDEERMANAQLEERVRALRERQDAEGPTDPGAELDAAQARVAELESAQAARQAELDAVLAELIPLLEEAV